MHGSGRSGSSRPAWPDERAQKTSKSRYQADRFRDAVAESDDAEAPANDEAQVSVAGLDRELGSEACAGDHANAEWERVHPIHGAFDDVGD